MPKRIRIGDMNLATTETTLYNGFNDHGTIVTHSIDRDPATGQSLGVGHVEYTTDAAGTTAIAAKHNTTFDGSVIAVTAEIE